MDPVHWLLDGYWTIGGHPVLHREVLGNAFGLASALLGMRRLTWAWPVGIVGNVILFTVFVSGIFDKPQVHDLWGQAGRQVFFLVVSVYGWWRWHQSKQRGGAPDGGAIVPRWARANELRAMILAATVMMFVFFYVLRWLDSFGPLADAWILTGSILATYGMARGYVDFWWIWVGVDIVGVPLLIRAEYYPSAAMYAIYGAFCLAGFVSWARAERRMHPDPADSSSLKPQEAMTSAEPRLDSIERAVAELATGRAVIVMDDESRENEGDLVFAASLATTELLAFTVRHTSGVVCTPMEGDRLDRLALPPMTSANNEAMRTAFTISVDAAVGVTTGISAADRTATISVLADQASTADDLVRPGHVFPLRYQPGGVLVRPGHTEAAVDLVRLAGLPAVGVIAELVNDDGTMRRGEQLREFADEHGLPLVSIADLVAYRRGQEALVERVATARLPTAAGDFTVVGYRDSVALEHVALVHGDLTDGADVLTRVHSECLTGDVFGSRRCDCGQQLRAAMEAIVQRGRGVVIYLRGHEGRGIGLLHKLQAYALQDRGLDTVEANLRLGLPADARDYAVGAAILAELGVGSVHLMTNNPAKERALDTHGVVVTQRIAMPVEINADNRRYLATKRDRMGHALDADLGEVLDIVMGRS